MYNKQDVISLLKNIDQDMAPLLTQKTLQSLKLAACIAQQLYPILKEKYNKKQRIIKISKIKCNGRRVFSIKQAKIILHHFQDVHHMMRNQNITIVQKNINPVLIEDDTPIIQVGGDDDSMAWYDFFFPLHVVESFIPLMGIWFDIGVVLLDIFSIILDFSGVVTVGVGNILEWMPDLLSGAISWSRMQFLDFALSMIGMIPVFGMIAYPVRWINKIIKYTTKSTKYAKYGEKAIKYTTKYVPKFAKHAEPFVKDTLTTGAQMFIGNQAIPYQQRLEQLQELQEQQAMMMDQPIQYGGKDVGLEDFRSVARYLQKLRPYLTDKKHLTTYRKIITMYKQNPYNPAITEYLQKFAQSLLQSQLSYI